MGFLKTFFGGKEDNPEERKAKEAARDFDMLKSEGVRALHTARFGHAVQCLSKALTIKDDLEVHDYLMQAYVNNDQLREGFEELKILEAAQPDNIHIITTMAKVAYMMEDYTTMCKMCEKAMLIDSDNAEVTFLYARGCRGLNDMVNAVAMYTKAIMLDSHFGAAYLERGDLLLTLGDIEGATDDADHLMEVAGDAEDVLLLKARVLMAQQQYSDAIALYDKTIAVNPFSVAAFKGRGAARLSLGDKEGAESDMRQVLEIAPEELSKMSGTFAAEGKD